LGHSTVTYTYTRNVCALCLRCAGNGDSMRPFNGPVLREACVSCAGSPTQSWCSEDCSWQCAEGPRRRPWCNPSPPTPAGGEFQRLWRSVGLSAAPRCPPAPRSRVPKIEDGLTCVQRVHGAADGALQVHAAAIWVSSSCPGVPKGSDSPPSARQRLPPPPLPAVRRFSKGICDFYILLVSAPFSENQRLSNRLLNFLTINTGA